MSGPYLGLGPFSVNIRGMNGTDLIKTIEGVMAHLKLDRADLFSNNTHEVSVAHQYAEELALHPYLGRYKIDLEYNRLGTETKRMPETGSTFRPDLIVHLPNTRFANLLAIEFHKTGDQSDEKEKLAVLTKRSGDFGYRLGILIGLNEDCQAWRYFVDGEIMNRDRAIERLELYAQEASSLWKEIGNMLHMETLTEEEVQNALWEAESSTDEEGYASHNAMNNVDSAVEREKLTLELYAYNSLKKLPGYLSKVFIPAYEALGDYLEYIQELELTREVAGYFSVIDDYLSYCHFSVISPDENIAKKYFAEVRRWSSESGFDDNQWWGDFQSEMASR